jgi:hypothetical protein
MSAPFDTYTRRAFHLLMRTMGVQAHWVPADGSLPEGLRAKVLFADPTRTKKVNQAEYAPYHWTMEFLRDRFPGLKQSVDHGGLEVITISESEYHVLKVTAKWNGEIWVAELQLKS